MTFESWFAQTHPGISSTSSQSVLKLAAEGATVPFIARYRKEQTGNLDEVQIRAVIDGNEEWDKLIERKKFVLDTIDKQKKLTPELKAKIEETFDTALIEDLYLPYKQKKKSKATLALEAGIGGLADWIWNCGHGTESPQLGQTLEIWAFTFKNEEKGFLDAAATIDGAREILIERLSEVQALRQLVRQNVQETGQIGTGKGKKAKSNSKFENYFDYHEKISSLLLPQNSHRYLAARRGWMEEELTLNIGFEPPNDSEKATTEERMVAAFQNESCTDLSFEGAKILQDAGRLAYKAHVFPAIDTEMHKALKDVADQQAINIFSENMRKLLLASPLGPKGVLGVDPGIRTGCKLAVVADSGQYLTSTVMHLQSNGEKEKAKALLKEVVGSGKIQAIAIGNGTAGRETELFIRSALKEAGLSTTVVMVSESGASIYSASDVAREEFPDLDLTVRGAISIARRLQDPLAELIKVDPKSIGVGQYQHDVSQPALKRSLDFVVDSCVNSVGVNLNTASYHLLAHVSGIGDALAKAIVEYRGKKGLFKSREELLEVPRFSKKAFELAAGFLRIPDGENALDNTGVHPERYPLLEGLANRIQMKVADLMGKGVELVKKDSTLKAEIGEFTFADIVNELEKPGRDPRDEFVPFSFRDDIQELKDLKAEMMCPGIVTNVTQFGVFVDIGVHQDGLVHLSQLSDKFVKDAKDVVSPGDHVQVKVLAVNLEKSQISLSMKTGQSQGQGQGRGRDRDRDEKRPSRSSRAPKPAPLAVSDGPRVAPRAAPISPMLGQGDSRRGAPPPVKPKTAFNNAFAALASLKDQLKK